MTARIDCEGVKGRVPEVAIVPSIVATDKMAKRSLTVSPRKVLAKHLGSLELRNLLAKRVILGRDVKVLNLLMASGLVDCHVEDTKV